MLIFRLFFVGLVVIFAAGAAADTLHRIKRSGTVKIGYRTDAPPFSYRKSNGKISGYTVDLCRGVVENLRGILNMRKITITYLPVSAKERFDALIQGHIDLLCGATTATLSRRELVDFSAATFITGASVIFRANGPSSFEELAGRKIGVVRGTTTEKDLGSTLKRLSVNAAVVAVATHDKGIAGLNTGKFDAYFGDRAILASLLAKRQSGLVDLRLSSKYFSYEPYALAMARGENQFRLYVDRALSRIYRSGEIKKIFRSAFGTSKPSATLQALYVINALPP